MALNSLHRHRLYGLSIESPFALPGAIALGHLETAPDLIITWCPGTALPAGHWRILQASSSAQFPHIAAAPDGRSCLTWEDELSFVISPDHRAITLVCRAAKLEFAPTVLVGCVLGFLLHLRGTLCLHGAALERDGRAAAFLGCGGAGKSTLAAAMIRRGAKLISDDLLALDGSGDRVLVQPGGASLRLRPDAAERLAVPEPLGPVPYLNKCSWDLSGSLDRQDPRYADRAMPLATAYVLQDGPGPVELGPVLPPAAGLRHLLAAQYPPGLTPLLTREKLAQWSALARVLPVRLVRYARTWDQLPRLLDRLWL